MKNVRLAGVERHSSVNGPGVRYVVFSQGCPHHCKGCQNPETWAEDKGHLLAISSLIEDIKKTKYLDGITFSGGDPLYQAEALLEIIKGLKETGLSFWCYTGWTYEEIRDGKAGEAAKEALSYLDVLVDGPFIREKKSTSCLFRGSTNQRLIDLKKSVLSKSVVEISSFDYGL